MKEKLKAFAFAAWSPQEKILLAVDLVLAGVLIGWLTSPLKGGIRWFCDNSFGGKFYEAAEAEEGGGSINDYHIERWINKRICTANVGL